MSPPLQLAYVLSAPRLELLPPSDREIAVVGRSNVGKSSLINALTNRKDLAHVSKTPGRTQMLNLFAHDTGGTLVDLPGYGYAAVSRSTRAAWGEMIEHYLLGRDGLVTVLVLVDGEIGPTRLDVDILAWLRSHELPVQVVATKQDKVKAAVRSKRKTELAQRCEVDGADVVWVSAARGLGLDRLRALVRQRLEG